MTTQPTWPFERRADPPEVARKQNSFDALRLLFALLVIIAHSYGLLNRADPFQVWTLLRYDLGKLGVTGFFAISGFLVTRSWLSHPDLVRFTLARGFRIVPAFFAALLFSVLIVAVEAPSAVEILTNSYTWRWVWRNGILVWHEFGTLMPGAFERNPLPNGANGSLWTLTYELRCYAAIAVFGLVTILSRRLGLYLLAGFLVVYYFKAVLDPKLGVRLFYYDLYLAFMTGMVIAARGYRPVGVLLGCVTLIAALIDAGNVPVKHAWFAPAQIALAAVIVSLANSTLLARLSFRSGDYSYGLFVYAFPLQQLVIANLADKAEPVLVCILTVLLTLPVAIASWHFLEHPALEWMRKITARMR